MLNRWNFLKTGFCEGIKVVRTNLNVSVPLIGAPQVWEQGLRGEGIQIAILDTGIDATHPDLDDLDGNPATNDPKVIIARDFTDDGTTLDIFGHGTHVAGIASGTGDIQGVAPHSFLWNVKVLNSQGFEFNSWIIAGVEFAALGPDGVPGTDDEADVLNMSLGASVNGDGNGPISQAVDFATSQGAVVAVAAGNSGPGMATVGMPGVSRTAITVGATNDNDAIASFSSRGPTLDLWIKPDVTAPGVNIMSTRSGGGYVSFSGTSMATPHVAGAAALIRQAHPAWDPGMVKAALMNNALVLPVPRLWDQGAGRIRVPEALNTSLMVMEPSYSFGELTSGDLVTADLTVRNLAEVGLTVDLSTFTTIDEIGSSDLVTITPSTINVLPLGAASAVITIAVGANPGGWYEGRVTVSGGGDTLTVPYLLRLNQSPAIVVTPAVFNEVATLQEALNRTLGISNTGLSNLTYSVRSAEAPAPAAAIHGDASAPSQTQRWATSRGRAPASMSAGLDAVPVGPQQLIPIINDPLGDNIGGPPHVDIIRVDGETDGVNTTIQIVFSDIAALNDILGFVHLDVDQNPLTGVPPTQWFGLPSQDIGAEYVLEIESSGGPPPPNPTPVPGPTPTPGPGVAPEANVLSISLWDSAGNFIADLPGQYVGPSLQATIPLDLVGQDDGFMDVTMVMGTSFEPTDWAPDAGHGTVGAALVPWICVDPSPGIVSPGANVDVGLVFNCLRDLASGTYNAEMVIDNNDPLNSPVIVPVTLEVASGLPPEIDVTPVSFDETLGSAQTVDRTLNIGNLGQGVLTFVTTPRDRSTGLEPTWLMVDPLTGFVDPGGTLPVQVTFDAGVLPVGVYSADLTIANNDLDENPVVVPVIMTISDADIDVNPVSFSRTQDRDEVTSADLTIANLGLGGLVFDIDLIDTTPAPVVVTRSAKPPAFLPVEGPSGTYGVEALGPRDAVGSTEASPTNGFRVLLLSGGHTDHTQETAADFAANMTGLTFETFFVTVAPPTLEFLETFDVVLLYEDGIYELSDAVGDLVHQYVLGGGNVVIGTFFWQDTWGQMHAIEPLASLGGSEYNADQMDPASLVQHPLTEGLQTLTVSSFHGGAQEIAGTMVVARWSDGVPLIGYQILGGGQHLVAISTFPDYSFFGGFTGDFFRM